MNERPLDREGTEHWRADEQVDGPRYQVVALGDDHDRGVESLCVGEAA